MAGHIAAYGSKKNNRVASPLNTPIKTISYPEVDAEGRPHLQVHTGAIKRAQDNFFLVNDVSPLAAASPVFILDQTSEFMDTES